MKKLVQINSVCGHSSTGRTTLDLAYMAESQGFDSYVFYGLRGTDYPNGIRFNSEWDVKTHILKTRFLGKHAFYSRRATQKLIDLLKNVQPDIIRLGQIHGHYLNVPILFDYLAESGIPVIWTLHDCWAMTGHCAHFTSIKCEKWKTGCFKCPQSKAYPKSLIFDRSKESWHDKKYFFQLPKNLTIVCPSDWMKSLAEQSFLSMHTIRTIYNGIDTAVFCPKDNLNLRKQYDVRQDNIVILGMANKWFDKKNLSRSLWILNHLSDNMTVWLIGVNKKQRVYLNNRVKTIPYINDIHELANVYSMCDVMINMSHEDSFSKVTAESMACGTPVIGFNATAIPEVIGDCGIVLETNASGKDILDAVINLALPSLDTLQKKGIERVKRLYNQDKNYNQYIELFKEKMR